MELRSCVPELDRLFTEALRPGQIIEWGLPPGKNGRIIPIRFLCGDIPLAVWIYPEGELDIYPPAWASQGVNLSRIFFLRSNEPVKQLRPIFLENTFKILIIDSPKKFSKGDLSFVAQKLRENKQLLFLIRSHYLSTGFGNPFARLRVNCILQANGFYKIHFVKGSQLVQILLPAKKVLDVFKCN